MTNDTNQRLPAFLSAVAGACSLSIALAWYWRSWDGGLSIPPPPPEDLMDFSALFGLTLFALVFQYGTPALSVPAILFGMPARRHWAGKAGLAMAAAALVLYTFYLRACAQAVTR